MKILLVDDDAFLRDMYATKFTELGHVVDVAETGEIALVMLHENTYDVAIVDMVMPGMDGVQLVTHIKEDKLAGDPICIMLSNQSEKTDRDRATHAGATGYIVKAELIPSEVVKEVSRLAEKK